MYTLVYVTGWLFLASALACRDIFVMYVFALLLSCIQPSLVQLSMPLFMVEYLALVNKLRMKLATSPVTQAMSCWAQLTGSVSLPTHGPGSIQVVAYFTVQCSTEMMTHSLCIHVTRLLTQVACCSVLLVITTVTPTLTS